MSAFGDHPPLSVPEGLQPLVDRLRFVFRHHGQQFGLTVDAGLVKEFHDAGVSALPYQRTRSVTEYEVRIPRPIEPAA